MNRTGSLTALKLQLWVSDPLCLQVLGLIRGQGPPGPAVGGLRQVLDLQSGPWRGELPVSCVSGSRTLSRTSLQVWSVWQRLLLSFNLISSFISCWFQASSRGRAENSSMLMVSCRLWLWNDPKQTCSFTAELLRTDLTRFWKHPDHYSSLAPDRGPLMRISWSDPQSLKQNIYVK